MQSGQTYRRSRAYISTLSTSHIHSRNPWVVAFFAFSFPGFGNLLQHRYAKAFTLILWEFFINTQAKLNLGILYTLIGDFEQARLVVDRRWILLYIGIYIYSIWDSYRSTVDLNKQYVLIERENPPLEPMTMGLWDINYLDKREPWVALMWSILCPGVGHLYVHKVITGFFVFAFTVVCMYFSHIPIAIYYTMFGQFDRVAPVLNMQWTLYMPSVYAFVFYDAYTSAVEQNKLFEKEQAQLLQRVYQSPWFPMPM